MRACVHTHTFSLNGCILKHFRTHRSFVISSEVTTTSRRVVVTHSYPFPDIVNFGVSYGKKNAPFWRIFRDSMRTLHNEHPGFTGVSMPYKLLEKYPHLLRIDRRLAVSI